MNTMNRIVGAVALLIAFAGTAAFANEKKIELNSEQLDQVTAASWGFNLSSLSLPPIEDFDVKTFPETGGQTVVKTFGNANIEREQLNGGFSTRVQVTPDNGGIAAAFVQTTFRSVSTNGTSTFTGGGFTGIASSR